MALDERNFRSTYYEKVGFRSVEEKKSLEILLKERPLDRGKLRQFCLRFCVHVAYRNLIWKILLDVIPIYVDIHEFVMEQRTIEYGDLLRCLKTIRMVDATTPRPQVFYSMWLLKKNRIYIDTVPTDGHNFYPIAQAFMHFTDDDVDVYWLTKCFLEHIKKFENDFPTLIKSTWQLLEKEDNELFGSFKQKGIVLPLDTWFNICFAGILNENALGKIWDKLCGGSCKILVFVAIALLTNQRHKLLKCVDLKSVNDSLKNIPEETGEVIANKSIEMWQQHGSPLTTIN